MRDFKQKLSTYANTTREFGYGCKWYNYPANIVSYASEKSVRYPLVRADGHKPTAYGASRQAFVPFAWQNVHYTGPHPSCGRYRIERTYHDVQPPIAKFAIGAISSGTSMLPIPDPYVMNSISHSLLSSLKNNQIHMGMTLANVHKTSTTIVTNVKRLIQLIHFVRRPIDTINKLDKNLQQFANRLDRNPKRVLEDAKRWSKDPARLLLEYNYAIVPLMKDIEGLMNLSSEKHLRPLRFTVKAKRVLEDGFNDYSPTSYASLRLDSVESQFYNAKVAASVSVPTAVGWFLSQNGLSSVDLALSAYDLVPLSFLVDWVIPISKWLEVYGVEEFYDFDHGFCSIYSKGSVLSEHRPGAGNIPTMPGLMTYEAFFRYPYVEFPSYSPVGDVNLRGLRGAAILASLLRLGTFRSLSRSQLSLTTR